ncbi:FeoB-associated Cys-rich membrane protein [Anaerosporobacter sp.]
MISIIIVALILLYAAFVIRKKVKDIKAGKFCNCGCSECPSSNKCHSNKTK